LGLVLVALPAWAKSLDQNLADCMSSDPATSISGCSAVIQSGKLTGPELAAVYAGRGFSYNNKGLHSQAVADFTKAIALTPNDSKAYINRGITFELNGQRDEAIADYRAAMKINPNDNNSKLALKRLGAL
jgi:Flp pilus assembly protein TadD